ncbi:TOBE domain-containing protein [Rhodocyclus tenuis]|uniref:TOBE domain-containing protein n=1 Tax=Rhodocyclus gracilis TaxID=2929842 RepID=A0ABX0WII6_9RHOO|nr:TOBE domain-containing protein [Rhodocyclus gracilis]
MTTSSSSKLVGKLAVETEFGNFLGDTRIRLLEAIGQHGSITQAAKTVPISYKAAWDAVDAMNNLAEQPLVERSAGGRHGGGTRLTDYGRRLVALYRAMEVEYQDTLDRLSEKLGEGGDVAQFRILLRRMQMKTSARNQFVGPVSALREGAVNFEVSLRFDGNQEITAMITRESAENLGLAIGREVHAFVKAQSVILMTEPAARTSARNHLWGTVARIHEGAVNSEITLALPGGRNVTAIVTRDSVAALALHEGADACAVINAASVLLATFD